MTMPTQLIDAKQRLFQNIPKTVFDLNPGDSGYQSHPDYRVNIETFTQRIELKINGITIASSLRALVLREDFHLPVYYLPSEDVRMDLMQKSSLTTYCPFKGYASYWHLPLGETRFENLIWAYENPFEEVAQIKGYISFDLSQPGIWYQEGEKLYQDWLTVFV